VRTIFSSKSRGARITATVAWLLYLVSRLHGQFYLHSSVSAVLFIICRYILPGLGDAGDRAFNTV